MPRHAMGLKRKRSKLSELGYTVVEVMMALAVLSIGATGVVAMQKASVVGNLRARNLATGNALASTWIERLRLDGLRWRVLTNGINTIDTETAWLREVGDDFPIIGGNEGQWIVPNVTSPAALEFTEVGADVRGMDDSLPANHGFCAHIRLTQLLPNLIRAEVRVFWLRQQGGGIDSSGTQLCDSTPAYVQALDLDTVRSRYHFVYMTTAILRNDA